jgi:outer membrane protein assembly factor BamB
MNPRCSFVAPPSRELRPRTRALQARVVLLPTLVVMCMLTASSREAAADWAAFRGGSDNKGVAEGTLPAKPELKWTFSAEDGFVATAAIAGGTVYAGSLDGRLYALDLATGRERWRYQAADAIQSSPLVADGAVYFGDEAGNLHAVDAATGEKRWVFAADGPVTASPARAGDCVLAGSYDNRLYCVRPATGEAAWSLETQGYVHGTPAVTAGGEAVVAGCDGMLRRVRLADGREAGAVELGGYAAASPALAGGHAFVGTFENKVLAVDLGEGKVAWTFAPKREFPFYASPAVAGEGGAALVIAPGRDREVHALAAGDGAERWSWAAGAQVDASPVVVGDRVLVATKAGKLAALDLASGVPGWTFDAGAGFDASPAVAGGRLVIGDEDGTLYCFG